MSATAAVVHQSQLSYRHAGNAWHKIRRRAFCCCTLFAYVQLHGSARTMDAQHIPALRFIVFSLIGSHDSTF